MKQFTAWGFTVLGVFILCSGACIREPEYGTIVSIQPPTAERPDGTTVVGVADGHRHVVFGQLGAIGERINIQGKPRH